MSGNYAALEAARLARGGTDPFGQRVSREVAPKPRAFLRSDFAVGKVYDADERFVAIYTGMTRDTAEAMAGRKRDEMSDSDVETACREGWNWGYRALRGNIGRPRTPFAPKKVCNAPASPVPASAGRVAKFGWPASASAARTAALSPERRSEIARKAGAARAWKCLCGKVATRRIERKYGRFQRRCEDCP